MEQKHVTLDKDAPKKPGFFDRIARVFEPVKEESLKTRGKLALSARRVFLDMVGGGAFNMVDTNKRSEGSRELFDISLFHDIAVTSVLMMGGIDRPELIPLYVAGRIVYGILTGLGREAVIDWGNDAGLFKKKVHNANP